MSHLWLPKGALIVVGMRAEAALLPPGARWLCAGGDPARLAAALDADTGPISALLSFGIAGGLDPALPSGTLLVATGVLESSGTWPADPEWAARIAAATGARPVTLAGAAEVVATAADKARLRAWTGAAAVDLESEVAASFAARRHLPFAALRAIADPAGAALPRCAAAGLTPDGRTAPLRVLAGLLRHPGELPELLAIARSSKTALATLRRAMQG
jgi:hopanoid-associated phosphorylase